MVDTNNAWIPLLACNSVDNLVHNKADNLFLTNLNFEQKGDSKMKKVLLILAVISLLLVSGCALGSASAAYSLKAQTAESLTAAYEEILIQRIESRIILKLKANERD